MSITFKILLDKRRKNEQQIYPVVARIYKNGAYKELALKIKVPVNQWNDDLKRVGNAFPQHQVINTKIALVQSKIEKAVLFAELSEQHQQPADIIALLQDQPIKPVPVHCLFKYSQQLINEFYATSRVGNAQVYECAVNKLKDFAKTAEFPFDSLTFKTMSDFNVAMLTGGTKVNTVSVYLRTIRAIYNRAIKEGLVSAATYPFIAFKIKTEKTASRALTIKEMQEIIKMDIPVNTPLWHWRNYFLLSFCLIGINFADLLKLTANNLADSRVSFRRSKTGKLYSIKLHDKANGILNHYMETHNSSCYLLPVLKMGVTPVQQKKDIKQAVKTCNEYLKRIAKALNIDKEVSTYYARYTWANIARQLGYAKDMIAEGLGHEIGSRVTGIYLDSYDNAIIDDMNKQVMDVVFKIKEREG